ncbi:hypothetical protein DFH06DRAFT_1131368 [Mycena polygramma]|nr:hypothetical protein DFH06DRAFT_1131368 [Mycena polygramma]
MHRGLNLGEWQAQTAKCWLNNSVKNTREIWTPLWIRHADDDGGKTGGRYRDAHSAAQRTSSLALTTRTYDGVRASTPGHKSASAPTTADFDLARGDLGIEQREEAPTKRTAIYMAWLDAFAAASVPATRALSIFATPRHLARLRNAPHHPSRHMSNVRTHRRDGDASVTANLVSATLDRPARLRHPKLSESSRTRYPAALAPTIAAYHWHSEMGGWDRRAYPVAAPRTRDGDDDGLTAPHPPLPACHAPYTLPMSIGHHRTVDGTPRPPFCAAVHPHSAPRSASSAAWSLLCALRAQAPDAVQAVQLSLCHRRSGSQSPALITAACRHARTCPEDSDVCAARTPDIRNTRCLSQDIRAKDTRKQEREEGRTHLPPLHTLNAWPTHTVSLPARGRLAGARESGHETRRREGKRRGMWIAEMLTRHDGLGRIQLVYTHPLAHSSQRVGAYTPAASPPPNTATPHAPRRTPPQLASSHRLSSAPCTEPSPRAHPCPRASSPRHLPLSSIPPPNSDHTTRSLPHPLRPPDATRDLKERLRERVYVPPYPDCAVLQRSVAKGGLHARHSTGIAAQKDGENGKDQGCDEAGHKIDAQLRTNEGRGGARDGADPYPRRQHAPIRHKGIQVGTDRHGAGHAFSHDADSYYAAIVRPSTPVVRAQRPEMHIPPMRSTDLSSPGPQVSIPRDPNLLQPRRDNDANSAYSSVDLLHRKGYALSNHEIGDVAGRKKRGGEDAECSAQGGLHRVHQATTHVAGPAGARMHMYTPMPGATGPGASFRRRGPANGPDRKQETPTRCHYPHTPPSPHARPWQHKKKDTSERTFIIRSRRSEHVHGILSLSNTLAWILGIPFVRRCFKLESTMVVSHSMRSMWNHVLLVSPAAQSKSKRANPEGFLLSHFSLEASQESSPKSSESREKEEMGPGDPR